MRLKNHLLLVGLIVAGVGLSLFGWVQGIRITPALRSEQPFNSLLTLAIQSPGAYWLLRSNRRGALVYIGLSLMCIGGLMLALIRGKPVSLVEYVFCTVTITTAACAWIWRDGLQ